MRVTRVEYAIDNSRSSSWNRQQARQDVMRRFNATMAEVKTQINDGDKVIVTVSPVVTKSAIFAQ